jgi:hypothetical protein
MHSAPLITHLPAQMSIVLVPLPCFASCMKTINKCCLQIPAAMILFLFHQTASWRQKHAKSASEDHDHAHQHGVYSRTISDIDDSSGSAHSYTSMSLNSSFGPGLGDSSGRLEVC